MMQGQVSTAGIVGHPSKLCQFLPGVQIDVRSGSVLMEFDILQIGQFRRFPSIAIFH